MLEIGGIVATGRQDDVRSARVHVVHHRLEPRAVVAVVHDRRRAEGSRVAASAKAPGDQGVARARGDAQVVLEHIPRAVLPFDQIDAGDVAVDAAGRGDSLALGEISRAREGKILRDDAVGDDLAVPVHVRQVQIEGADALDEARFERLPGARLDYAGDGVEGEEPLVEGSVLIDAELHAVARELLVDLGGVLHEVGVGRLLVELLFLLGRQTGLLPRT